MEKLKCGKPEKSYVSKIMNWFLWVVFYKTSKNSTVKAEVFKKKKDAYGFYKTLKGE